MRTLIKRSFIDLAIYKPCFSYKKFVSVCWKNTRHSFSPPGALVTEGRKGYTKCTFNSCLEIVAREHCRRRMLSCTQGETLHPLFGITWGADDTQTSPYRKVAMGAALTVSPIRRAVTILPMTYSSTCNSSTASSNVRWCRSTAPHFPHMRSCLSQRAQSQ